jgi:DNA-binding NtrC family response regulator
VDDEEVVLSLERELLEGKFRSVCAARNSREAQKVLESEPFDLVVVDLKMEGDFAGRDLYEWICEPRREMSSRVIFTVSGTGAEEADPVRSRRKRAFLQKPFGADEFLTEVLHALSAQYFVFRIRRWRLDSSPVRTWR